MGSGGNVLDAGRDEHVLTDEQHAIADMGQPRRLHI
jgi:hypothetical protein